MDAGEIPQGTSLDWVKVTRLLGEKFSSEEADLLFRLYGLEGYKPHSAKELRKKTKLKKKAHHKKMLELQKKLFHLLKDKDPQGLFLAGEENDI